MIAGEQAKDIEAREATYRHRHQRISNVQHLLPMQHQTPIKVSPSLHGRHIRRDEFCRRSNELALYTSDILPVQPLLILDRRVYRAIKRPRPLGVSRVEVRM